MASISNLQMINPDRDSYKPLQTVQVNQLEDIGSSQRTQVWGIPTGTLAPCAYDVFSKICGDAQPLPRTIREILTAGPVGGENAALHYTGMCKRMDSTELLGALAGLAGVGVMLDSGLAVTALQPGCSAEHCGCIRIGDVVTAIDGRQTKQSIEALGWLLGR
jgi:hypothetical protein